MHTPHLLELRAKKNGLVMNFNVPSKWKINILNNLALNWKKMCPFIFHYILKTNHKLIGPCNNVTTLLWESVKMRLTLLKWWLGSPPRLRKLQSSIAGVKTPRIGAFFISLKSYQSVNVENGLAWAIWTFASQVMAKKKVGSQTGSLIPDH